MYRFLNTLVVETSVQKCVTERCFHNRVITTVKLTNENDLAQLEMLCKTVWVKSMFVTVVLLA